MKMLQTIRLGEIISIQKIKNSKELPYVGMEDIESNSGIFIGSVEPKSVKSSTFHFSNEHLLYGRLRPYLNKILLPDFEGHCSTEIFPLKVNNDLSRKYLFYWLTSEEIVKRINKTCTGTRMPRANMKEVMSFEIPFPPLSEQRRIVKILDEVFEEVGKAKENAEKNLRNSRELFESYLQKVFENKGGEWEEKRLGDKNLLTIIDGDRGKNYPKKSDFLDDGYCLFLSTKNVRPNGFRFENKAFITKEKDLALGNGKLQRDDVIMTTRGTIGNLGLYNKGINFNDIRINSGMLIFRPNLKMISSEYLFEVFRSGIFKMQIKKYVSGAAQPQLPIKTLVNFTIPVPNSLSEQKAIVKKLDALSEETKKLEENYRKEIEDLEELKKSVLQKAFRGEL